MHTTNNQLIKKLIAILIFMFGFQSWTMSDDIRDFEIEGVSIGDSILKHYSNEDIDTAHSVNFGEYNKLLFYKNLNQYESLLMVYKKNDKDFIIKGLTGNIVIDTDINACYRKMEIMDKEISKLFANLERRDWGIMKTPNEYQTYYPITYDFDNQDRIQIACYDFRIGKNEDNTDGDLLKISMYESDYRKASAISAEKAN